MNELLKDYVRRIRNEKGYSTQKVEELSKGSISDGYVSKIENGHIKNVSPEKLKALAKGLGVTEEEIFAAARGLNPNTTTIADERFAVISKGYAELTLEEREAIEPFIVAIEQSLDRSKSKRLDRGIEVITKSGQKFKIENLGVVSTEATVDDFDFSEEEYDAESSFEDKSNNRKAA